MSNPKICGFFLAALVATAALAQDSRPADHTGRMPPTDHGSRSGRPTESGPTAAPPGGESRPAKPRRGIPVTEPLLFKYCIACHTVNEEGMMSRISYLRKSPEGWELSLKRMIRLQDIRPTPEDARAIVSYLSNSHGLARKEAERGLYEVERRVHWSENEQDSEFRQTCAACHSLGRVLNEQRDLDEWKTLKATHLAFFPLVDWQAFRSRDGGHIGPQPDLANLTEAEMEDYFTRRREEARTAPDRADKILEKLSKDQPLFSRDWEEWQVSRREVPIEGTWIVVGHEVGRGDVTGSMTLRRTAEDQYETLWNLVYGDGTRVARKGKGVLYAGYSWRGRSARGDGVPNTEPESLREVLLLADDWTRFEGRIFTGEYNELGMDVKLWRETGATMVLAAPNAAVMIPSTGSVIGVEGLAFPDNLNPADFHLGAGVTVTAARRLSATRAEITVDVARGAERGTRRVAFRAAPGPRAVVLYDTIDYIRIQPVDGFSRVGGAAMPRQYERFEAVAMSRGADDKPYTPDDTPIMVVPVTWSLEEFPVREGDDDVKFVGTIDPRTGLFTPNVDGPNPARRWKANNIGDVYVVATCSLRVQKLPEKPTSQPTSRPASAPTTRPVIKPPPPNTPIVMEDRIFRARGHLLVTVPIYVRYDRYDWDRR